VSVSFSFFFSLFFFFSFAYFFKKKKSNQIKSKPIKTHPSPPPYWDPLVTGGVPPGAASHESLIGRLHPSTVARVYPHTLRGPGSGGAAGDIVRAAVGAWTARGYEGGPHPLADAFSFAPLPAHLTAKPSHLLPAQAAVEDGDGEAALLRVLKGASQLPPAGGFGDVHTARRVGLPSAPSTVTLRLALRLRHSLETASILSDALAREALRNGDGSAGAASWRDLGAPDAMWALAKLLEIAEVNPGVVLPMIGVGLNNHYPTSTPPSQYKPGQQRLAAGTVCYPEPCYLEDMPELDGAKKESAGAAAAAAAAAAAGSLSQADTGGDAAAAATATDAADAAAGVADPATGAAGTGFGTGSASSAGGMPAEAGGASASASAAAADDAAAAIAAAAVIDDNAAAIPAVPPSPTPGFDPLVRQLVDAVAVAMGGRRAAAAAASGVYVAICTTQGGAKGEDDDPFADVLDDDGEPHRGHVHGRYYGYRLYDSADGGLPTRYGWWTMGPAGRLDAIALTSLGPPPHPAMLVTPTVYATAREEGLLGGGRPQQDQQQQSQQQSQQSQHQQQQLLQQDQDQEYQLGSGQSSLLVPSDASQRRRVLDADASHFASLAAAGARALGGDVREDAASTQTLQQHYPLPVLLPLFQRLTQCEAPPSLTAPATAALAILLRSRDLSIVSMAAAVFARGARDMTLYEPVHREVLLTMIHFLSAPHASLLVPALTCIASLALVTANERILVALDTQVGGDEKEREKKKGGRRKSFMVFFFSNIHILQIKPH
jgi:hypothetical protein